MRLALVLAAALLVGCTTSHGWVDYRELGVYSHENAGNRKFADIGPVAVRSRTFAWGNCDQLSKGVVIELLQIARARGGNTVYKILFEGDNGLSAVPTCTTGWGWFVLYIVGGLGPWVQTSAAEGVAAKVDQGDKVGTGAIRIPENAADFDAAAEAYLASLPR